MKKEEEEERGRWATLPPELLEKIFLLLGEVDSRAAEETCARWSAVVVARLWGPRIRRWAREDSHFAEVVETSAASLSEGEGEHERTRRLYLGLVAGVWEEGWRRGESSSRRRSSCWTLDRSSAVDFAGRKVCAAVAHARGKLFLARQSGRVESWRIASGGGEEETPPVLKRVLSPGVAGTNGLIAHAGEFKLALSAGGVLAGTDFARGKVLTWRADTEEPLASFASPLVRGPIYDLALTSKAVLCLSLWSVVAYDVEDPSARPVILPDVSGGGIVTAEEEDQGSRGWLESHCLEASEDLVVTVSSSRDAGRSFVRARKLTVASNSKSGSGGRINLSPRPVFFRQSNSHEEGGVEYQSARLSGKNLLAVLELTGSDSAVKIFNLASEKAGVQCICSLPSGRHPLSLVHLPVSWVGDRLFLRRVPAPESDEAEVTLVYWDFKENSGDMVPVADVVMATPNDLLFLGYLRLIRIYNSYPTFTSPSGSGASAPAASAVSAEPSSSSPSTSSVTSPTVSEPEFQIKCAVIDCSCCVLAD